MRRSPCPLPFCLLLLMLAIVGCTPTRGLWTQIIREERHLNVRELSQLPQAPIPPVPPPETVSQPAPEDATPTAISLDQAIRIALANSEVVRVLAGVTAVSSGQTIYDPAISVTQIDDAKSVFDPQLNLGNVFNRTEQPFAIIDPNAPKGAIITGTRTDQYDVNLGLSKRTLHGGTLGLDVANTHSNFNQFGTPLDPQDRSSLTLSYTQPLLAGAGVDVNLAPIVIARINTERSYFQFKDSVQELVRGVIEAYWGVVFARIDVWAREQQVRQGQEAFELANARQKRGFGSLGEVAQARVALFNFRSSLIAAEANLLNRETALRNIMGLPPTDPPRIIVTTPPIATRVQPKWEEIVRLAGERRPDLIELKLILEADQQTLLQAENQAQPRVDATVFYRWNGLEGRTPSGRFLESGGGEFTDWSMGVNFSVPLGLRQSRAALRSAELRIRRDRANLEQGMHRVVHDLAANIRNLDQNYEQYQLLKEAREAARINLEQQIAERRARGAIQLNLLQAITDWGNAVSGEAQALAQYNSELANLERQTGTILESHGIRFFEERYRSIGPLHQRWEGACYPLAVIPSPNEPRYPDSGEPADQFFNLETIPSLLEEAPLPRPKLPPPRKIPDPGDGSKE